MASSARVAVCGAAMIVLIGCGKSANNQARTTPQLPPTVSVSPTASIPANAVPCRARDIRLQPTGQYPGDAGDRGTLINIVGRTNPCALEGTPFTTVKDSEGRVISVPPDKPGQGPSVPKGTKVVVSPGRPAVLRLFAPRECSSGLNQGPPWYLQISVRVGGETVSATGLRVPASCREVSVSPFYQG